MLLASLRFLQISATQRKNYYESELCFDSPYYVYMVISRLGLGAPFFLIYIYIDAAGSVNFHE